MNRVYKKMMEAFSAWDEEYIKTDGNDMSVIHTHEDLENAFIAGYQAARRHEADHSLFSYTLGG
jgi:hypothetical protein